jgi:ferritin-like metal-binding protein YciE
MATRDAFLVNWVKTAYSMELGLVPVLEKQTTQVQGDPELRQAIDRHLQQTRQHAELLPKTEIPGMGWYAIFADPTGNRLGLFSM